eukprot:gene5509-biopygen4811
MVIGLAVPDAGESYCMKKGADRLFQAGFLSLIKAADNVTDLCVVDSTPMRKVSAATYNDEIFNCGSTLQRVDAPDDADADDTEAIMQCTLPFTLNKGTPYEFSVSIGCQDNGIGCLCPASECPTFGPASVQSPCEGCGEDPICQGVQTNSDGTLICDWVPDIDSDFVDFDAPSPAFWSVVQYM